MKNIKFLKLTLSELFLPILSDLHTPFTCLIAFSRVYDPAFWKVQCGKSLAEDKNIGVVIMMETPFPKSISFAKKYSRLLEIVKPSDTLGILINADP